MAFEDGKQVEKTAEELTNEQVYACEKLGLLWLMTVEKLGRLRLITFKKIGPFFLEDY